MEHGMKRSDSGKGRTDIERLIAEWDQSKERHSGRFIVRYRPGKDAVLVEPAIATLEAAYQALAADLKVNVEQPILVPKIAVQVDFGEEQRQVLEVLRIEKRSGVIPPFRDPPPVAHDVLVVGKQQVVVMSSILSSPVGGKVELN
jgi:hypothetical protein